MKNFAGVASPRHRHTQHEKMKETIIHTVQHTQKPKHLWECTTAMQLVIQHSTSHEENQNTKDVASAQTHTVNDTVQGPAARHRPQSLRHNAVDPTDTVTHAMAYMRWRRAGRRAAGTRSGAMQPASDSQLDIGEQTA